MRQAALRSDCSNDISFFESPMQILAYIRERLGDGCGESPSGAACGTSAAPPVAKCQATLQQDAALLNLVRNPFVLTLFVEIQPAISATEGQALTKSKIYSKFVRQWFSREVGRLDPWSQEELGVRGRGSGGGPGLLTQEDLVSRFELLAGLLAWEMLRSGRLEVSAADVHESAPSTLDVIWERYNEVSMKWVVEVAEERARKAAVSAQLASTRVRAAVNAASQAALTAVELVRVVGPLRRIGTGLEFAHKSLWEYFCARLILCIAGGDAPLDARVQQTSSLLALGDSRRIQAEPEVLLFLVDHWRHVYVDDSDVGRARECLFHVISGSRAVALSEGSGAAANAATILNWMGEPMVHQAWDGVDLAGADLTRAVLCGTSMKGANLAGCRLVRAALQGVCLDKANLAGADFGAPPLISVGFPVRCMRAHPMLPNMLAVLGSNVTQLFDVATGCCLATKFVDKEATVVCLALGSFSTSASVTLVKGYADGVIRGWDLKTSDGGVLSMHECEQDMFSHHRVHHAAITCIEFCGGVVVSGDAHGNVMSWVQSPTPVHVIHRGHHRLGGVVAIAGVMSSHESASTNQAVLAVAISPDKVHLFSLDCGSGLAVPMASVVNSGGVFCLALLKTPGGDLMLVCGGPDGAAIWNASTASSSPTLVTKFPVHADAVTCVAVIVTPPHGRHHVACGTMGGRVLVVDPIAMSFTTPPWSHSGTVRDAALLSDAVGCLTLLTCSDDGSVRVWSLQERGTPTGVACVRVTCAALVKVAARPGEWRRGIVVGCDDGTIQVRDLESRRPVCDSVQGHQGLVMSIATCASTKDPSVEWVVTGSRFGVILVWEWSSQEKKLLCHGVRVQYFESCVMRLAAVESTQGWLIVVASGPNQGVCAWRVNPDDESFSELGRMASSWVPGLAGAPVALAHCQREDQTSTMHMAVGGPDGCVWLWRLDDRLHQVSGQHAVSQTLVGHRSRVICVACAWSPAHEEAIVASGSEDCTARLWSTSSGMCIGSLLGHSDRITSVVLSQPTCRGDLVLASGAVNGDVWLWDLASLCCLRRLAAAGDSIEFLVLSMSRLHAMLASFDAEGVCRAWSLQLSQDSGDRLDIDSHGISWVSQSVNQSLQTEGLSMTDCQGAIGPSSSIVVPRAVSASNDSGISNVGGKSIGPGNP
jgi:WD40 repeat protein